MGLTIEEKKKIIAQIIWSFINSLFIFKYSYRVSLTAALICTAIYNIVTGYLLFLCSKRKFSLPKAIWPWILGGISILGAAAFYFIPVESIRVDRWEMIQIFWDSVHQGIYPYAVHSPAGNYPGPMPFYFILSYPFYLIQEIGWMGIIAVWLVYLYIKNKKLDKESDTFVFTVLLLSATIYYEIITRSTILLNSIIFLIYFLSLENIERQSKAKFYIYAFIGGIIL
ncbi:MAG: hypothetical protein IJY44_06720 [Bacteroidaceae bacterium]|nr:hypothetical protein [Bacteroidaceae bacterium]